MVLTLRLVLGFLIRELDDFLPLPFPCPSSTGPPSALRTVQKLGANLSSVTYDSDFGQVTSLLWASVSSHEQWFHLRVHRIFVRFK